MLSPELIIIEHGSVLLFWKFIRFPTTINYSSIVLFDYLKILSTSSSSIPSCSSIPMFSSSILSESMSSLSSKHSDSSKVQVLKLEGVRFCFNQSSSSSGLCFGKSKLCSLICCMGVPGVSAPSSESLSEFSSDVCLIN